jgi:hypothetical protein
MNPINKILGKEKLIFEDSGGNKLFSKVLKNGKEQIYAKNVKGKLVNKCGVLTMMKRAGWKNIKR